MNADQTTGRQLIQWFKNAGCTLNDSIGIALLPGMGRGIVALQDIPASTFAQQIKLHLTLLLSH